MPVLRFLYVFALLSAPVRQVYAQPCPTHAVLLKSKAEYERSVLMDSSKKMVDLARFIPGVQLDLRYATKQNFTGLQLYPTAVAMMRAVPARALAGVQEALRSKGYGLRIYDAYRPFSVTCTMWRKTKDRHYVANPAKASRHNRGLAADLTLVDLKSGKELDMGTGFDSFTDSAHYDFPGLTPQASANRRILRSAMQYAGFTPIPGEWWHFNWPDKAERYEALDLRFQDLQGAE